MLLNLQVNVHKSEQLFIVEGFHMLKIYNELMEGMSKGVLDTLPEVHATSAGTDSCRNAVDLLSGLKSLTTRMAAEGIESCRLACGGHGYTSMSGLPDGYVDYVGTLTAEGENYLLTQQTTRYLLKVYDKSQQSGLV
jgi:acyl-CoA oxidase